MCLTACIHRTVFAAQQKSFLYWSGDYECVHAFSFFQARLFLKILKTITHDVIPGLKQLLFEIQETLLHSFYKRWGKFFLLIVIFSDSGLSRKKLHVCRKTPTLVVGSRYELELSNLQKTTCSKLQTVRWTLEIHVFSIIKLRLLLIKRLQLFQYTMHSDIFWQHI